MPTVKPNLAEKIIGQIFKNFDSNYGLKEFADYRPGEILNISEQEPGRFYIKDLKKGVFKLVYDENKHTSRPEEIIRQLWLYKLHHHYLYPFDRIDTEKSIHFGREIHTKAADIVVYHKDKITPFIIIEVKSPTEKKGVEQLKTYLNSEWSEIGVWSDGIERVILYLPYPREFEGSLSDIPRADQTIDDLFEVKKTYKELNSK